nr:hypothetical protein [uncultured Sphingomonas sp.]
MAQPLQARKKAVDLAGGPRRVGSRIRRAPPPPPEKKLSAAEIREREAWMVGTGIVVIALALMVILFAAVRWGGWSPADYAVSF